MAKGYHQLTYEQRCQIYALSKRGDNSAVIAKQLGVNRSTVGREFKRNLGQKGYRYEQAHRCCKARRINRAPPNHKIKLGLKTRIDKDIKTYQFSPVQISGRLGLEGIQISPEAIYQYIWKDKQHKGTLYLNLRHRGKKYHKRGKLKAGRGCIPNRRDISERPSIVDTKLRFGDWELDTIIGKGHKGAIVSMVERTSKYVLLLKVSQKTAEEVEKALIQRLEPLKKWVYTLTSDNGKEFANHIQVAAKLECDFFFARPYHSWERGLNEHTNGLVRQYIPKKTRFTQVTEERVAYIELMLNNRPRKTLGFKTPQEVFDEQCSNQEVSLAKRSTA